MTNYFSVRFADEPLIVRLLQGVENSHGRVVSYCIKLFKFNIVKTGDGAVDCRRIQAVPGPAAIKHKKIEQLES